MSVFKEQFRSAYLRSLDHYRHFYDDFSEYGNPETARFAFYFVPGINGTPGQIRIALPSLIKRFGRGLYIRGCYLPEFSATRPVWEKYEDGNVEKKRSRIAADLEEMLARFANVYVIASSNGFYDYFRAAARLPREAADRITLMWIACAPDRFEISPWVEVFHRWNGFVHEEARWAAVPNHNALTVLNPETSITHEWDHEGQSRLYFKEDVESRFRCFGVHWVYTSPECFNRALDSVRASGVEPLAKTSYVLAAANDGYWYGKPAEALESTIARYLKAPLVLSRPSSHLWLVTPDHLTEYLRGIPDHPTR